jgi:hypothetical protein
MTAHLVTTFRIDVADEELADLRRRLLPSHSLMCSGSMSTGTDVTTVFGR